MVDVVSVEVRSRMMSRIRSKNTKPEIIVRRALWRTGFRYRVHDRTLPGTPDISNKSRKLAIFVDGCFWHGCPECYTKPENNAGFWSAKLLANRTRREKVRTDLEEMGFMVVEIWEHETVDPDAVANRVIAALEYRRSNVAIN